MTMRGFRARLTAKITVVIVLVLVVGFGVSTILTIQRESALLVEQNKMAARRLIGTLVASIETAMLSERPDITRGLIADLRSSKLVTGLMVYRRNGVEAFTDLATLREVSKEAELPKGVMASIEKMRREPGRTMAGPLFTRALETLQTSRSPTRSAARAATARTTRCARSSRWPPRWSRSWRRCGCSAIARS